MSESQALLQVLRKAADPDAVAAIERLIQTGRDLSLIHI